MKKPFYKKWWFYVLIIAVLIAAFSGSPSDTEQTEQSSQPAISQSDTPSEITEPEPTVETFKAGQYKIGTDIPAGEYRLVSENSFGGYFAVTSDSTGNFQSILANDNFQTNSIIYVIDGQYLELVNCVAYNIEDAPEPVIIDGMLQSGMYRIGVDIPAGEYKVIVDKDAILNSGYIEVSSASDHNFSSIVTNDNFEGEKYITVSDGQYLKLSSCQLRID